MVKTSKETNLRRTQLYPSHSGGSKAPVSWQVICMKGVANQSWSNTSPSGHMKVRLNATGGAGSISGHKSHSKRSEGLTFITKAKVADLYITKD